MAQEMYIPHDQGGVVHRTPKMSNRTSRKADSRMGNIIHMDYRKPALAKR
jgi:hypothetical protein